MTPSSPSFIHFTLLLLLSSLCPVILYYCILYNDSAVKPSPFWALWGHKNQILAPGRLGVDPNGPFPCVHIILCATASLLLSETS